MHKWVCRTQPGCRDAAAPSAIPILKQCLKNGSVTERLTLQEERILTDVTIHVVATSFAIFGTRLAFVVSLVVSLAAGGSAFAIFQVIVIYACSACLAVIARPTRTRTGLAFPFNTVAIVTNSALTSLDAARKLEEAVILTSRTDIWSYNRTVYRVD